MRKGDQDLKLGLHQEDERYKMGILKRGEKTGPGGDLENRGGGQDVGGL